MLIRLKSIELNVYCTFLFSLFFLGMFTYCCNTFANEYIYCSYPIVFQPLAELGAALTARKTPGACVLVSNDVVGPLYSTKALESLKAISSDQVIFGE